MYLGKRQKFDWVFVLAAGDAVMVLAAIFVSLHEAAIIPSLEEGLGPLDTGWLGAIIVYLALVVFALKHSNLYAWVALKDRWLKPVRLIYTMSAAGFAFFLLVFLLGGHHPQVIRWIVLQTIFSIALIWIGRLFLRYLMMDIFKLIPEERIAFIGWTLRLERVIKSLQGQMGKFQTVLGYFDPTGQSNPEVEAKGFHFLGDLGELEAVHEKENITLLIVDEAMLAFVQLQELAAVCSRSIINFRMIPSAFDILSTRLSTRVVAGVPLMGIQGVPFDLFHNRLAKRCVDIVGSIVGLVFSTPIILACAVFIKRESPGPIFYRQIRLGRGGRTFEIIKLRSMKIDAEKETGAKWAVQDDPRRLKIGAFMRKWNLDETPQFWNVLKGEMSLVGPRPERPQFVESFSQSVRHYNLRHNCKPGLTSWAAVHGLRGNTSLTDRLDFDLYYFENWSLWLDFKTMVFTLLPPKNAY
jgi:exopolysaccharide biosynthesis polyprenyl glycosylphosphotransferase